MLGLLAGLAAANVPPALRGGPVEDLIDLVLDLVCDVLDC